MIGFLGVVLGMLFGLLPGLGPLNGVAILLPITFVLPPESSMIFIAAIYYAGTAGGAITSITLNIPGTPMAAATCMDGHPMAQKGKGALAIFTAANSSLIGGTLACIGFVFLAPPLAKYALMFGPPEFFALMVAAFACFGGLAGKSVTKTIIMTIFGLLLACVGMDVMTGNARLCFGYMGLFNGVTFLTAVVGMFGIGEVLTTIEKGIKAKIIHPKVTWKDYVESLRLIYKHKILVISDTILGFLVGVLPGAGATPASFMAYGFSKSMSKDPKEWGKGHAPGVMATESSNHAASTGAFVPMVTLGIPGSPLAAIVLGGMLIWGLVPGPRLFIEQPRFVWGLIVAGFVVNILAYIFEVSLVPLLMKVLKTPFTVLTPLIVIFCLITGYVQNFGMMEVVQTLIFGVLGYFCKKTDYPVSPLILAIVLGPMTEWTFRQSLLQGGGSPMIFVTHPISFVLLLVSVVLYGIPITRGILDRRREKREAA
ncbi:MAG: tripartite tricarboxylate transporter permease [Proteobacteria bacterium]|nr:tripartite tricarboxylate transporter permease [Pseudomonadota bacterium]